jgi:hypothetical protein
MAGILAVAGEDWQATSAKREVRVRVSNFPT